MGSPRGLQLFSMHLGLKVAFPLDVLVRNLDELHILYFCHYIPTCALLCFNLWSCFLYSLSFAVVADDDNKFVKDKHIVGTCGLTI